MLKVYSMGYPYQYEHIDMSPQELFDDNNCFILGIEAPIYWWLEFNGERARVILPYTPKNIDRDSLKKLPLSTTMRSNVFLHYQEIIEIVEDYILQAYSDENTKWIAGREWKDFCETLMDIRGVRELLHDLIEEEYYEQ